MAIVAFVFAAAAFVAYPVWLLFIFEPSLSWFGWLAGGAAIVIAEAMVFLIYAVIDRIPPRPKTAT